MGIKYHKTRNPTHCLIGFADADWAGVQSEHKSYSGYCFTLDGNLISWVSRKQKLAALSTTEAEYISVTEATKESLYLNELVGDLFECGEQKVTIYNDNESAIKKAFTPNFSTRTKHMGVRKQFVRDCIESGLIDLVHIKSEFMPADILTKPLERVKHKNCCEYLKMSSD